MTEQTVQYTIREYPVRLPPKGSQYTMRFPKGSKILNLRWINGQPKQFVMCPVGVETLEAFHFLCCDDFSSEVGVLMLRFSDIEPIKLHAEEIYSVHIRADLLPLPHIDAIVTLHIPKQVQIGKIIVKDGAVYIEVVDKDEWVGEKSPIKLYMVDTGSIVPPNTEYRGTINIPGHLLKHCYIERRSSS